MFWHIFSQKIKTVEKALIIPMTYQIKHLVLIGLIMRLATKAVELSGSRTRQVWNASFVFSLAKAALNVLKMHQKPLTPSIYQMHMMEELQICVSLLYLSIDSLTSH